MSLNFDFIEKCANDFKSKPENIIARNAISTVGLTLSTTNSERVNKIDHIFLNSVKRKHVKATNQGASGRCWMFAALNTFRHILINALNLENFEFSETYLFFWDKLERSNYYLKWMIENRNLPVTDRGFEYMINDYMGDGGFWNDFANLVNKYGVVPLSAMKETYQSDDSEDMNKIIKERLESTVNYIRKNPKIDFDKLRLKTVQNIYDILVKFLGEPPKKFDWSFVVEEDPSIISKNTPLQFLNMIIPDVNMNEDFVVLANLPHMKYYTKYRVKMTENMVDGKGIEFFNIPIEDIARFSIKSISAGVAVWFACDVRQYLNIFQGTLDDTLNDYDIVFGKTLPFNKGDRLLIGNIKGCHAMALTGFNINEKSIVNWQVENSWGYLDKDTEGMNGFLTMSHSWFEKYVTEAVINKKFFTRSFRDKMSKAETIEMNPWDNGVLSRKYPISSIYPDVFLSPLKRFKK